MGTEELRAAWVAYMRTQVETRHAAMTALFHLVASDVAMPPRVAEAVGEFRAAWSEELAAMDVWAQLRVAADVAELEAVVR